MVMFFINVIQFTGTRERDTRFHLLQNTTVKNIIDLKGRHVARSIISVKILLLTAKLD